MLEIKPNVNEKDKTASNDIEEVFRRVKPFIRKPVEQPIVQKPWKTVGSSREVSIKRVVN